MSTRIKNPNEKGNGFTVILIAVLVIAVAVIGFVVYQGKSANAPTAADVEPTNFSISTEKDWITLQSDNATADTPEVDIYEDYSCPHCRELAEASDAAMKEAIENGSLIVHIHPLDFLAQQGAQHSTLAGAAAQAVADTGDAQAYWNYRSKLMLDQQKIYNSWKAQEFADYATSLGVDSKTVDVIKNGTNIEAFQELANNNAKKINDTIGRVSSPQVIFNGAAINLDPANLAGWVDEVTQ